MCFGNMIGFEFSGKMDEKELFSPHYGSLILEVEKGFDAESRLKGLEWSELGETNSEKYVTVNGRNISLEGTLGKWLEPLEGIFPTKTEEIRLKVQNVEFRKDRTDRAVTRTSAIKPKISPPRIFIPVFPGTNCEYDSARAFEKAGGKADVLVLKNLTPSHIEESIQAIRKKISESQIIMLPGGFSAGDEPDGSGKFIATAFRNPYIAEAVMELIKNRDGLILGICNGFQALIKLGLVPYGEIRDLKDDSPTLTFNTIGRHVSRMVKTRIASDLSPWFNNVKTGDIHTIAVSHGEGRFVAKEEEIIRLAESGQIATQYVYYEGNASYDIRFNPNGSMFAVEGITSPDGRVLGKMGHSERIGSNVCKNVPGEKDQKLFEAGVSYFL
jgi:phosphoribosylformylglycinamidine synthase